MAPIVSKTVTLRTGASMPAIGLGTWKAPKRSTKEAVQVAVKAGYRLIDTANDYDNEDVIGEALQELFVQGVVKREELFIQSKLWNSNHRPGHIREDLMATLKELQLDYLDSFVIHWPMAVPATGKEARLRPGGCYPAHHAKGTMMPVNDDGYYCYDKDSHYIETWHEMEKLVDEGLVRSIGLSNFNLTQIREVVTKTIKHLPSVLQNESHPYLQEKDLRDFCRIHKIAFQAYSALGSSDRPWRDAGSLTSGPPVTGHELLQHPTMLQLATKHNKSAAHIALRWHLQMGGTAVCKSVTPQRIEDNYKVWDFELSSEDMDAISDLNVGWRHLVWAETSMHKDYPFKDWLPYDYELGKPGDGTTANVN